MTWALAGGARPRSRRFLRPGHKGRKDEVNHFSGEVRMKKKAILAGAALVPLFFSLPGAKEASFHFPETRKNTLDNGLAVYFHRKAEVPLVSIYLLVKAGSANDPAGLEGISCLTAGLLASGSSLAGEKDIFEEVERAGGKLSVDSGKERTVIKGSFLAEEAESGFEVIGRMVTEPCFSPVALENEKKSVLSEIEILAERDFSLAGALLEELIFSGSPLEHSERGYPETVRAAEVQDVREFYSGNFTPERSVLVISGDIGRREALGLARRSFSKWKGGGGGAAGPGTGRAQKSEEGRVVVIDLPGASRSQVRLGAVAPPREAKEYFALKVANNILGVGFTSRLKKEIRTRRGLAYHVGSRLDYYGHSGYFAAFASTGNSGLEETLRGMLGEIGRMGDEEVSEEELEGAVRYITGLFPFSMETNDDICRRVAEMHAFIPRKGFYWGFIEGIQKVSARDVLLSSRRRLSPESLDILIITDYSVTRNQLEWLKGIEVLQEDDIINGLSVSRR